MVTSTQGSKQTHGWPNEGASDEAYSVFAPGNLALLSGKQALHAFHGALCGPGLVDAAGVAEGVAQAGGRAASRLGKGNDGALTDFTAARIEGSLVLLRRQDAHDRLADQGLFSFCAGSVQQALDFSIAAHLLSERFGAPVVLSVPADVADMPAPALFPDRVRLNALLSRNTAWVKASGHADASDAHARNEHLGVVLAEVEELVGRALHVTEKLRMDDAEVAFLVPMSAEFVCRTLIDGLRASGIRAGAICRALKRPLPYGDLDEDLGKVATWGILEEGWLSPLRHALSAAERDDGVIKSGSLDYESPLYPQLLDFIHACLPNSLRNQLDIKSLPTPKDADLHVALQGPGRALAQCAGLMAHGFRLNVLPRLDGGFSLGHGLLDPASTSRPADVLVCMGAPDRIHPRTLDGLKRGASVLVMASFPSPEGLWNTLHHDQRQCLKDRDLRLYWLDADEVLNGHTEGLGTVLHGALLSILDQRATLSWLPEKVWTTIPAKGLNALIPRAAEACQAIQPEALNQALLEPPLDIMPRRLLPVLPELAEEDVPEAMTEWERFFWMAPQRGIDHGMVPLALKALKASGRGTEHLPLIIDENQGVSSFKTWLENVLARVMEQGGRAEITAAHQDMLVSQAMMVMHDKRISRLADVLHQAAQGMKDALELSENGASALAEELPQLLGHVPEHARVVGFDTQAMVTLLVEMVRDQRTRQVAPLLEEMRDLVRRLNDILTLDRHQSEEGREPATIAGSLGSFGSRYIDASVLSSTLPGTRGSVALDEARKRRLEGIKRDLESFLAADSSAVTLVHDLDENVDWLAEEDRVLMHENPFQAALGVLLCGAEEVCAVLRAVRAARLEVEHAYDPEVHDSLLAQSRWKHAGTAERALLRPVVVLGRADQVRSVQASAVKQSLSSDYPLFAVILDDLQPCTQDGSAKLSDLGVQLALELSAAVVQSSVLRPVHLTQAWAEVLAAGSGAVAVVCGAPMKDAGCPWWTMEAALEGRLAPLLTRVTDFGFPQIQLGALNDADRPWPVHEVPVLTADGQETQLDVEFTAVDALAMDPLSAGHLLPVQGGGDRLIHAADFLAMETPSRDVLPFIWMIDDRGTLVKAVVSSHLIEQTRKVASMWRKTQELAGIHNRYAAAASEQVRQELQAAHDAAIQQLEKDHEEALQHAQAESGREAMERLARVLLNMDMIGAAPAAPSPSASPAAKAPAIQEQAEAIAAPAAAQPEPEDEDEGFSADPFIDSDLCTTCNECTNLNPQMFKYNASKQAFIADAGAGTFAQLVTAAEKCPARCIHPGAPREGDSTATPELVEKAARFN